MKPESKSIITIHPNTFAKRYLEKRLGGNCFINLCAAGETLLALNIEKYLYQLLSEGHYCEVVSNMTVSKVINEICSWDKNILSRLEFKCSFHYLELKRRNLLNVFADNVNKCWNAGASISIEITPHDELIPYIDEIKAFSLKHFGALPHISIARRDDTKAIQKMTELTEEEYIKTWETFDSSFWRFKQFIFGKKRTEFCCAGSWLLDIDLATGITSQCYCTKYTQNVFESPNKKISTIPYGKNCKQPHCFNGHSMLTLGCIPDFDSPTYAEVRDRVRTDGSHWLQKEYYAFISQKLQNNNKKPSVMQVKTNDLRIFVHKAISKANRILKKITKACR